MQDSDQLKAILLKKIYSYYITQAIAVAAKLNLPYYLKDGPRNYQDLANITQTHPPSLLRLMRVLVSEELLVEEPKNEFKLTPLGHLLRSDNEESLHDLALLHGNHLFWDAWKDLEYCIKTGSSAIAYQYEKEAFHIFEEMPELGQLFDRAMGRLSQLDSRYISRHFNFTEVGSLVDIGGGQGRLVIDILTNNTHCYGKIYDRPALEIDCNEFIKLHGLSQRCAFIGGDFFESLPKNADLYILKHILHNWSDEECLVILNNCCHVLEKKSRLWVIETVVDNNYQNSIVFLRDLHMLVTMPGGCERDIDKYQMLFHKSNLKLMNVYPLPSKMTIMELKRE